MCKSLNSNYISSIPWGRSKDATRGSGHLTGARTLLGAPGIATRSKDATRAPGSATRSKDATEQGRY